MQEKRVFVGLSGGVDSSVAALLLLEKGFHVEGLFMKNWEEDDTENHCSAAYDLEDARDVCTKLKIPLHTVNFSSEYWDNVFVHCLQEYKAGRTPNPDVLCNREIKFKAFLKYAKSLNANFIATGHYAQIIKTQSTYQLQKGSDLNKDQSYFLYALDQKALSQSLFPLGNLKKGTVRKLAKQAGFKNHEKKDSTGICFIGERKFKTFLARFLKAQPGLIQSPEGTIVGEHDGLMYHTLGQRQGLKIGGRQGFNQSPWYVAKKDLKNNRLIVVQGINHPLLFSENARVSQLSWISGSFPEYQKQALSAKIRYRQVDVPCSIVECMQGCFIVQFKKPQRAVTPGQSIVFYLDQICLGGGIIE